MGAVLEATEASLEAAKHLTEMDAGAVEALRSLARILDAMLDEPEEGREREVKFDNVTIPTYLKYCESLGLTPAGRDRLSLKKKDDEGARRGGKLVALQGGIKRPGQA